MISNDDEKNRKKLGERLKNAREKLGLTQAEVATKAGLNANYYAVVERGEGNLSFEKLQRIMKVLGIKTLEIL
jgi:transcriptional regulator with XRE-family HTH domain